jgi:radical SAM superfamily enzyme YgiQ (UPF0313 family)
VFIHAIEQGPIRPPSEAQSLLLRITRNCSWNRCEFCHIYKNQPFTIRSVEDVKKDIDTIKAMADEIYVFSRSQGFGGEIHSSPAKSILNYPHQYPDGYRSIILWLHAGAKTVFLQDADNLIHKTKNLVEILTYLKKTFPSVERVTTYSRARTIARKSVEELREIHEAGLSRIHTGLETGYEPLLDFVQKGVNPQEQIDAGRKVKAAGISLSEYIMPGLGGKSMWREHATETAKVLNQIDPDFIRVRTLKVLDIMPLYSKIISKELELLSDDETVAELRLLIENLAGITSHFVSDHILNLLGELEGKLPEAKTTMLATIDRYLALSNADRANFRLGRRANFYNTLDDMDNPGLRSNVDAIMRRIETKNPGNLDAVLSEIMESFI